MEAGNPRRPALTYRRAWVTDVNLAVHVLNQMLNLGRPSYVLSPDPNARLGLVRLHP